MGLPVKQVVDAAAPSGEPGAGLAGQRLRIAGYADVSFKESGGATRLDALAHHDPLRVLFPRPLPGDPPTAAMVTTSGGLVGGDRLDIRAAAGPDARALVLQQAAEKVYRSTGPDTHVSVTLAGDAGSWLEWLPQETILFDRARLRRRTLIEAAPGARILAGEMLVFGRIAMGERLATGLVRDEWQVRRAGRLVWADALHLDGDFSVTLARAACFDSAAAMASAVYVADEAETALEKAREILARTGSAAGHGPRSGATLVNGVLVMRWIGPDAAEVRGAFGAFWQEFRAAIGGLPGRLPRLWHV